jgi:hypothetical protein
LSSCTDDIHIGAEQSQSFIKFYGGSEKDFPTDIVKYNDGYAITGTMKTADSAMQAFVIITDKYGNETLATPVTFGGKFDETGNKILVLANGDLLVVGTTASDAGGDTTDIFASRIRSNGILVWNKTYGGTSKEEGLFGLSTASGNLIIGGYTESSGNGGKDVYILKLDSNGNTEWTSELGGTGNDIGYDIIEVNNNLLVAGSTESFNYSEKKMDVFLINVDNITGKALYFNTLGNASSEKAVKLVSLPDNDLLVLAQANNNTTESNHIQLYRTTSTFIEKWNKPLDVTGTYDIASDMFLSNTTVSIIGTSYKSQNSDFLIHTMDVNGNLISSAPQLANGNQVAAAGFTDADGSFLYVGAVINIGYQQIVLVKGL